MAKRDYYDVLGVGKSATESEMKTAFRKAAMACHPDRHPNDPGAEARFRELNEAYQTLSDAQNRAAYDRFGHSASDSTARGKNTDGGFRPEDLYKNYNPKDPFGWSPPTSFESTLERFNQHASMADADMLATFVRQKPELAIQIIEGVDKHRLMSTKNGGDIGVGILIDALCEVNPEAYLARVVPEYTKRFSDYGTPSDARMLRRVVVQNPELAAQIIEGVSVFRFIDQLAHANTKKLGEALATANPDAYFARILPDIIKDFNKYCEAFYANMLTSIAQQHPASADTIKRGVTPSLLERTPTLSEAVDAAIRAQATGRTAVMEKAVLGA